MKVPDLTNASCSAANLAEPSAAGCAMKCFRNRSSCSIKARSSGFRITPRFAAFRERIAPEQMIVGEDQPTGDVLEPELSVRGFHPARFGSVWPVDV